MNTSSQKTKCALVGYIHPSTQRKLKPQPYLAYTKSTEYRMTEIEALHVPLNPTTRDQNVFQTYPYPMTTEDKSTAIPSLHNVDRLPADRGQNTPDATESVHSKCHYIERLAELVGTLKLKCGFLHLLVAACNKQVPL